MYSVHVLAKGATRACGASADASLAATSTLNMLPGPSGMYQDTTIFIQNVSQGEQPKLLLTITL